MEKIGHPELPLLQINLRVCPASNKDYVSGRKRNFPIGFRKERSGKEERKRKEKKEVENSRFFLFFFPGMKEGAHIVIDEFSFSFFFAAGIGKGGSAWY